MSQTIKELETTYGILFIGYATAMIVYGLTFFQAYVYFSRYPLDHWAIKTMVTSLCLLDTITSVLISDALYHYLITTFPNNPPLLDVTPTYCAEIGVSIFAVLIVQIYYSHRVWMVSQNAVIGIGIAVISLTAFALGMVATGNLAKNLVFTSLSTPQAKAILGSSLGLTLLSGTATFIALKFYLSPLQNPSMVKSTKEGLYDMVVERVTRGCIATTVQFGYFVAFLSVPSQVIWMPFHLLASKTFINSLLAMLNVRQIHQGHGVNEGDNISRATDTTSSSIHPPNLNSNIRFASAESKSIEGTQTNDNHNQYS